MNLNLAKFQIWEKIRIIPHALIIMINQLVTNIDLDFKMTADVSRNNEHRIGKA